MTNANEFLEGMLGAYKARVAPFNVNYRYVADELVYLLDNAHAAAVITTRSSGPSWPRRSTSSADSADPRRRRVRQRAAARGRALRGAAGVRTRPSRWTWRFAGRPLRAVHRRHHRDAQGVLWRQHDIYLNAMGGRAFGTGEMMSGLDEIVARVAGRRPGFAARARP